MKKIADGFEFEIRPDGTAELIRFTDDEVKKLVIPAKIEGHPVKRIADRFATNRGGYSTRRECIEEAVVPEGVEEIGFQAFGYCENLRKLTLPASVVKIDRNLVEHSGAEKVYDELYARACTDYHLWRELQVDVHDPYREEYNTHVVVKAGSYAETYCKENRIPYTAK